MRPIVTMLGLMFACAGLASITHAEEGSERPECPGEKRALVLSGGGVRGAYQVGALWYLVNVARCNFDHFVGTSTGAVAAAVLSEAQDFEELRKRVTELVDDYRDLKKESQVVSKYRLRYLRLILPRWLGGVDGTATLDPITKKLEKRMTERPRRNLTIAVVSLQGGKVYNRSHRPESLREFVIGSASIPVGINPQRARLWVRAAPEHFKDNTLTLCAAGTPGLPDPACQIKLAEGWVVRCKALSWGPEPFPELVQLRLSLSESDQERLARMVRRSKEQEFGCPLSIGEMDRVPFELSTIDQLVDGGVAQHTPLSDAVEARPDVDYFFILHTGSPPYEFPRTELRGGIEIGKAALSLLWEAYQNSAIEADLTRLNYEHVTCRMKELAKELPRDSGLRERLSSLLPNYLHPDATGPGNEMLAKRCDSRFRLLWIEPGLSPAKDYQVDTLKPDPQKIPEALHIGCLMAGSNLAHARDHGLDEPPFLRFWPGGPFSPELIAACEPLKPQSTRKPAAERSGP